jgi:thiamine-monophosphate kinase
LYEPSVTTSSGEDLASLGEFGLIASICALLPQGSDVLVGPGDDAAVVKVSDAYVVATTDMAVENVHFRRDWSTASQIGQKIAAANLADILSMGARPTALLIALGAPPDLATNWVLELAVGIRDEAAKVGASVVGGDTVRSEKIVISVTALGSLDGRKPILRSGAQLGDLVVLAGTSGLSAAGLALLKSEDAESHEDLRLAHRSPKVEYELALALALAGVHSMCDVSDGLLADLGHIAGASEVKCRIDPSKLNLAHLLDAGGSLGVDPLFWALTGGEDHAFVATIAPDSALPEGVHIIGEVIAGSGVEVVGLDVSRWQTGHEHFRTSVR